MKEKNRTAYNSNRALSLSEQDAHRSKDERQGPRASRRYLARYSLWIAAIALSLLIVSSAGAQNLGSPPFANPPEVRSDQPSKTLRMVMELSSSDDYQIPGVGKQTLRQFRGWDASASRPKPSTDISPGPTLRARLGDRVQVSFFNKIDDRMFPYTFVSDSPPGKSDFGCDKVGTRNNTTNPPMIFPYPAADKYPNCFHGSSTANIHFHGTHTSPDGLGDNVLVQVLPQLRQPDWTSTFNQIFNSTSIPQKWLDLPEDYRDKQMDMINQYDTDAAAAAKKNGLPPPDPLAPANQYMIDHGQWPQYIMGAFPNYLDIPDYSSGKFKAGQAPGTHWYHAHKHGSTSLHLRNGLAGALIIESSQPDGYDHFIRSFYRWGDSYGDHEKIFVLQQFDPTQNLERTRSAAGGPPPNPGNGSKQTLVNGKLTPTIKMRPGEVQLWRFINATQGNLFGNGIIDSSLFETKGFTFRQTAMDGVQFSPANYAAQPFLRKLKPVPGGLSLAAGNRADVLVQAPKTAGVTEFKITNPAGNPTIFFVEVKDTPVNLPKPFPTTWATLPDFLKDLRPPGPRDEKNPNSPVKFQWDAGRAGPGLLPATALGFPPHYMINGKQFEESGPKVDQCMPLNGLQDWVLENYTTVIAHPFHIHINPFQVIKIETPAGVGKDKPPAKVTYTTYAPAKDRVWQDVIAIPPAVIDKQGHVWPGKVTIRQTYVDFTGTYVLHCHILAHEDRGMMQLVRVVPLANYPGSCQNNVPAHH